MKAINGFQDVKAASDGYEKLPAGGYVCRIVRVVDVPEKEYLRIDYDILDGDYAKYFENWYNRQGKQWWPGSFIRSYKTSSLGFLKSFLKCVDDSNGTNYTAQAEVGFNEQMLVRKQIGLVLGYEEYKANNGSIKQRIRVASTRTVAEIQDCKYKVPELKTLNDVPVATSVPDIGFTSLDGTDSDLPF